MWSKISAALLQSDEVGCRSKTAASKIDECVPVCSNSRTDGSFITSK